MSPLDMPLMMLNQQLQGRFDIHRFHDRLVMALGPEVPPVNEFEMVSINQIEHFARQQGIPIDQILNFFHEEGLYGQVSQLVQEYEMQMMHHQGGYEQQMDFTMKFAICCMPGMECWNSAYENSAGRGAMEAEL
jgi:hypothetical protein